jgi:hypothetical protein
VVFAILAASTFAGLAFKHPLPFQRGDMVSLEIVVPGDVLVGKGLGGWGQVWITYPGGYLYASIPLDGRDRSIKFTFNLTEAKARAHRVLARLAELGSVEYATLHFTAYIVKDDGSKCIATFTYSTLDYYRDQTPIPGRAEKLAMANPLALLEAGRLTVKKGKMTDCMPFTTPLDKAAEGFKPTGIRVKPAELAPTTTTKLDHRDPTSLGVGIESINPPPPSTPSCPLSFAEVVFPNLYNQRYSPPDPWLDRVILDPCCEGDRQKIVGDLWYQFATLLSIAYYYPSWCSSSSVLYSTAYYTRLPEGVHTMENVVYRMAEITGWSSAVKGWQNEYFPGDTFKLYDRAPVARIEMHYYGQQYPNKPIYILRYEIEKINVEYIGVALKGVPIISYARNHTYDIKLGTYVEPKSDVIEGFIYAPLYAIYEFDGLIVEYYIGKTIVDGTEYWKVVPLFYYAPIYTLDYDYIAAKNITGNPYDPIVGPLINELNEVFFNLSSLLGDSDRSYYTEWIDVFEGNIEPTPGGGIIMLLDSNKVNSTTTATDLSWYLTFLANLAVYVGQIFSGLNTGFFKLSTLADPLVDVTWIQVNSEEIDTELWVIIDSDTPTVYVDVNKLSIEPSFLTEYYSSLGKFPPLYTYRIIVVER